MRCCECVVGFEGVVVTRRVFLCDLLLMTSFITDNTLYCILLTITADQRDHVFLKLYTHRVFV